MLFKSGAFATRFCAGKSRCGNPTAI
jgi:hypothetical protein